jgi:hypothetical protein
LETFVESRTESPAKAQHWTRSLRRRAAGVNSSSR